MNIAAIYFFIYSLWAVPTFLSPHTIRVPTNRSQYEVHSFPNATLPLSWAGRLPVPETPAGNSLFFWLFEAEDPTYDENLIIWFNGGPGCSSLIGLTTGNGPVSFDGNSTRLIQNPHSWTKLGHVLYVDQPVGTGYSTASNPYPVLDNDRVTSDFYRWLRNFFTLFPHLRSKQVHMIGESWAGIYIPYFASAIVQGQDSFPINLRSISIGDGTIGNAAAMSTITIGSFMRSQKDILQIPNEILSVFTEAEKRCGFDHILKAADQYPPKGKIRIPGNPENRNYKRHQHLDVRNLVDETCNIEPTTPDMVRTSILNSTCYGPCATFATAFDYLGAMSASGAGKQCHDIYDTHNNCETIDPLDLLASYFSRADVQVALNLLPAAAGKDNDGNSPATLSPVNFAPCNSTILTTLLSSSSPVAPAYSILPDLVTTHKIPLHIYSGENDFLLNHFGTELSLQNMTWNGAQGFSQKPNRPFFSDNAAPTHSCDKENTTEACGDEAGVWGSERGVTYHLFWGAGHSVFGKKPREMFAYVRDVVVVAG
ncbi:Serine carboxypeptidase [Aspergillus parasiticus SU-1]|uniref:Pheromone-processing carboxypeptidase KEX1 n=1 Tax=Aspergillus parasiticus (strain ATCC 56775 / NRRL 5862 / SRRC 143 / SU-1) TaxID=1403190 RepID=A0A0F0IM72_ASPPU|nr:Serine carboxypeptidase [Aspergillus parasiticus SU-1]